MRRFMLARIWTALSKHPNVTAPALADITGLDRTCISNGLRNLKYRGNAVFDGSGRHGLWRAIGTKPEDRWGTHPNSLVNLEDQWPNWRESLDKAQKARGVAIASPPRKRTPDSKRAMCDLQRLWSNDFSGKREPEIME